MSKPRTAKTSMAPKDAILEAAMAVFSAGGVSATRVEDLIAAAKVSRRTFYKYFGSKEEVLAALYELMTGALLDVIGIADGLEPIHAGIDAYLDFHVVGTRLLRVLLEQAMRSESKLYPRRRWLRQRLIEVLQAAARPGTDPMLLWALLSMLEGLSLHLLETDAGEAEVARARRTLHALVDQLL